MRRHPTLSTFAFSWAAPAPVAVASVVLVVLTATGCNRSTPPDAAMSAGLTTVQQVRVDPSGAVTPVADNAGAPAPADPAGDGNAVCPPLSIAMAGPLGADATGGAIQNGIQLAIDRHNAANTRCQVQLKPFDTAGGAAGAATQIVDDAYTVGLVGPVSSDAAQETGDVFNRAGLVAVTPTATGTGLSGNGWRTFFRGLASDAAQGAAAADYLTGTLGNRKVCVVELDGSGLAQAVRQLLGPVADPACNIVLKQGETDNSAPAQQITDARPDSVFYGGPAADAAPFVEQLRERGYKGTVVGAEGTHTPETGTFAEEYTAKFSTDPARYSADGYDLGTILLKGIDAGAITRPAMLEFVRGYQGQGVVRKYAWTDDGELQNADVWIYQAS